MFFIPPAGAGGLFQDAKIITMAGLAKILRAYGEMKVTQDGKTTVWAWDYANEKARIKSEMTKEELKASDEAKKKLIAE